MKWNYAESKCSCNIELQPVNDSDSDSNPIILKEITTANGKEYIGQQPLTSIEQIDKEIYKIIEKDVSNKYSNRVTPEGLANTMKVLNHQVNNKQKVKATGVSDCEQTKSLRRKM